MDEKEVQRLVAEAVKSAIAQEREQAKAEAEAQAEQDAEIAKQVEAAVKAEKDKWAAENRLPGGEAPHQMKFASTSKYDNLDDGDLSLLIDIVKSAPNRNAHDAETAMKALAVRYAESDKPEHQPARRAMKMADMPLKSDELNNSTLANYGDEWVGVSYSSELWEKIRQESPVVSRIPTVEVPQGMESIVIPVESSAPTFYKVAQAADQAANPGAITRTVTTSRASPSRGRCRSRTGSPCAPGARCPRARPA